MNTIEIPDGTNQKELARSVACPVRYCRARPGHDCVSMTGRVVMLHPARLFVALRPVRK
jgi:hypothetical protein